MHGKKVTSTFTKSSTCSIKSSRKSLTLSKKISASSSVSSSSKDFVKEVPSARKEYATRLSGCGVLETTADTTIPTTNRKSAQSLIQGKISTLSIAFCIIRHLLNAMYSYIEQIIFSISNIKQLDNAAQDDTIAEQTFTLDTSKSGYRNVVSTELLQLLVIPCPI